MSAPKDRANEPSRRYVAKGIDRLEEESNKVYLAEKANKEDVNSAKFEGELLPKVGVSPHHCLQCGAGDHKTEEC